MKSQELYMSAQVVTTESCLSAILTAFAFKNGTARRASFRSIGEGPPLERFNRMVHSRIFKSYRKLLQGF